VDAEESPAPEATPTPEATTDTVITDAGDPIVVADEQVVFEPVSESAPALAVSWTLLVLVLVVLGGVYLLWRYIGGTRERLYLAIDEAAEAARQESASRREDVAP